MSRYLPTKPPRGRACAALLPQWVRLNHLENVLQRLLLMSGNDASPLAPSAGDQQADLRRLHIVVRGPQTGT